MKKHLCLPESKLVTILFSLAIFLCGCSSSYLVSSTGKPDADYSYQEMNEELKGQDVKIVLKDRRDISVKDIKISDDSVSWVDQETDEEIRASIQQLDRIITKNHFLGSLEWMGFGLVGGGGLGALLGNSGSGGRMGSSFGAAIGLIVGGGAGIIVGLITGLIIGHSYNYEFQTTEQSDSLQNGK